MSFFNSPKRLREFNSDTELGTQTNNSLKSQFKASHLSQSVLNLLDLPFHDKGHL